MSGPAQLRVRVLGDLDVEGVDGRALGSRKARTLLRVLALARGAPVAADALVDALWPDGGAPGRPAEQVGVLVSRLRGVLGADRLPRTDAGWTLRADWLDLVELDGRVDEAAARLASGSPAAARAAARAALALVRGDPAGDEPDARWAEVERAAVVRTVARARLVGAEAALAAGEPVEAAVAAEGALDHDPYDEASLRVLMRAHTAAGRPASALAAYARVRHRLAEDLGIDPAAETEDLHRAILLGEVPAEPAAPPASARPPLAGRADQLAALDRLLDQASTGPAVLAVVEGEAGIGKTALVSAWAAGHAGDALVLRGRCDELGRDLPLQPVLDGLDEHLRTLDPPAATAVLTDAGPVLGPLLGRYAAPAGAPSSGPTSVADPAAGQARFFAALLAAIERAAGDRPVVVVAEDVHLAGASTVEWLHFAARRGRRLLVVATFRPPGPPVAGAVRVAVGPLDRAAVAELVGDERAAELHARSGGHPLFLQELARAPGSELPASVRQAVAARVDALGLAAATLRAQAVLGGEVDVDLLAGVLDQPVAPLLAHLEAGIRALVIEERGPALTFRHDLVREALAADTTSARRAFLHRQAARVLSDRPASDPLEVAWHARLGGDAGRAAAALTDAAAVAGGRFDSAAADQLLSEAVDLVDSPGVRLARARVRIGRLRLADAEEDAERALALGGGAEALEVAGWAAYYRRNFELARRRAEEAAARTDDPGVRASSLALSGRLLHASGGLREADPRLAEAVATAPVGVRGVAQVFLGGLRVHQGEVAEGGELAARALVDPTQLSHPFAVHHGHLFRVLALGMGGRPLEALAEAELGHRRARAAGEQGERFLTVHDNLRGWVLRHLGAFGEADDHTARALERASGQRDRQGEMYYAAALDRAEALLLAGDIDAAGGAVADLAALETWDGGHAWHHRQRFGTLQARLALAGGDHDGAEQLADGVVDDAGARGTRRYGLLAAVTGAGARATAGRALDHEAVERCLAGLDTCAGLEAWRVTAELAARTGVDRWWRDAERRAGSLIAAAGPERGEGLRRYVAATFSVLGR